MRAFKRHCAIGDAEELESIADDDDAVLRFKLPKCKSSRGECSSHSCAAIDRLLKWRFLSSPLPFNAPWKGEWAVERRKEHFDRRQQIDLTPAECKNDSAEVERVCCEMKWVCSSKVALTITWEGHQQEKIRHKVSSHWEQSALATHSLLCHSADVGN